MAILEGAFNSSTWIEISRNAVKEIKDLGRQAFNGLGIEPLMPEETVKPVVIDTDHQEHVL